MNRSRCFFWSFTIGLLLLLFAPCSGQYREYYVQGKILDKDNQPIAEVEILLRETESSESFAMKTNNKGEFKLAGLPHGTFAVTIQKSGYQTVQTEWNFAQPQDRMQKVELQPIIMLTAEQIKNIELNKQLQAELNEATVKIRGGDFDGAIAILDKMLAAKTDDANALYLLGICQLKKKMYREASTCFERVLSMNPAFASALVQLGICQHQQQEMEKALSAYGKALTLEPNNLIALYNSGIVLYETKRAAEAIPFLEKALAQKTDDPEILEMLGYCYIHTENYAKAIESLEKAQQLFSDPAKVKAIAELLQTLKRQTAKEKPKVNK